MPDIPAKIVRTHIENPGCAKVYAPRCSGPILFSPSGWKGTIQFPPDRASIGFAVEGQDEPEGLWAGHRPQLKLRQPASMRVVAVSTGIKVWSDEIVGGTNHNVGFTPSIDVELAPVSGTPRERHQESADRQDTERQMTHGVASLEVEYPFIVDDQDFLETGVYENRLRPLDDREVRFFPMSAAEADFLNGTPEKGVGRAVLLVVLGIVAIAISSIAALITMLFIGEAQPDPRAMEKVKEEFRRLDEAAQQRAEADEKAYRERHTVSMAGTRRSSPRPPQTDRTQPRPPRRPPRKPGR